MILENGIVRTMDPSLPASRALAIAGAVRRRRCRRARDSACEPRGRRPRRPLRAARAHRLARPLPDLVDGSAEVKLDGCASLDEALARVRGRRDARRGAGCAATAGATATGPVARQPTKEALDEITGETPTIMISKDYHSVWLNSAALAAAGGDLDVRGRRRRARRAAASRPASFARSRRGGSTSGT